MSNDDVISAVKEFFDQPRQHLDKVEALAHT